MPGVGPGAHLPAGTHVGAVRLQVSDLQRSIDYYENTLGLRVHERDSGVAMLTPRADATPLVLLHEKHGVAPAPARGTFGLYHFAVLLPDRAALGRFVAHLGRVGARGGAADHLVSEAIYLTDPDGLGIEVYADRPRETWQYADGELKMTTDPLDLDDLRAAAGDRRWNGAPAGTTMGHVHLHVGDLDDAERFYSTELGLDVTVRGYPGARFFAAGGYHHHVGTNTWSPGPSARDDQAKLLDWELIVPGAESRTVVDPWGTVVRITPELYPQGVVSRVQTPFD